MARLTDEAEGINGAVVNMMKQVNGANVGLVNITEGYSKVDISGFSISDKSDLRVGIINITGEMETLQIGLLNVAENGFLPVFPFFNYPKKK